MKKIFYDLETTGLKYYKHGIHQIAGLIEIDGEVVHEFDIKTRPNPKAEIDPEALRTRNVTLEQFTAYQPMKEAYRKFIGLLSRYIDRYDKNDKAYLVGYNNQSFDNQFLREWFLQNDDPYFGSWFYSDSHDVLVLASVYLQGRRQNMPNFQLKTVAKELGLVVEEDKLHDAKYDVGLTRGIYNIVTGLDYEI